MQKADHPEDNHPAAAPREVLELVARFGQQIEAYKSGHYNEAQLRQEFLNPLFKAFGWDTRQIAVTDTQVDRLVYDLYALTEEEIRIVEGAT